LFTRDFDWYKLPNLSHNFFVESSPETFNNTKSARQIESYSFPFFQVSPILPSTYPSEWFLGIPFPLFLIYKEIFNFKLPKLKILAIEFFDLYPRTAFHSFKHNFKDL
jgi:hypothetical protein